jgi:3-oxoacyl-(acyl-carrier-protein) synthase
MESRIVVTGIGIVSAIGMNVGETYNSLILQKSGISKISILETIHRDEFLLGEIKQSNEELIKLAGLNPSEPWTRTTLLGILAAQQAFNDAGFLKSDKIKTGIVSASTVGGMDKSELFYKDFLGEAKHKNFIDTHHAGASTEKIAEHLEIQEYITTISTACSSSLNSIMFGARLIEHGIIDRVLVGGTDSLSKFTLNGFNTLMILDREHCRPFDASRRGLNLGEGAGFLVLEREVDAVKANKKIYAALSGYANANDAFHQTASSDDGTGPFLAMEGALKKSKLKASDIDYINVHGTGTDNNDLTEGIAMKRLFGDNVPAFSSTKPYTGHTLGAAGVVESIIALLAMNNNVIFPNINFKTAIPEIGLKPITEIQKKEINHVLTNSFGFGGNDSSIIFSKHQTQDLEPKTQDSKIETPAYINGIGTVLPLEFNFSENLSEEFLERNERFLQIAPPDYKEFINPKELRRMSKIIRMGIVAAKMAMTDAGIESPDAIITGTGMGCQADTEKFLNNMLHDNETLLNPTAFIQSTHNTIGAQIALMLGNNNYNFAYVHRTFSFESALLDSMMMLKEDESNNILLGGIDEITEESWLIRTKIDYFKKNPISNFNLLTDQQGGALGGEGAAFFILSSQKNDKTFAAIKDVKTFFSPKSDSGIEQNIISFLIENQLKVNDIDLVISGYNGDSAFDAIYKNLESGLFSENSIAFYKHICGEFDTSSAVAVALAANILKTNHIPKMMLLIEKKPKAFKRILIYNQFRNINHSLILLEKARN